MVSAKLGMLGIRQLDVSLGNRVNRSVSTPVTLMLTASFSGTGSSPALYVYTQLPVTCSKISKTSNSHPIRKNLKLKVSMKWKFTLLFYDPFVNDSSTLFLFVFLFISSFLIKITSLEM